MYVVTVLFKVSAASADTFLARLHRQASDSLAVEPGCRRFDVCTDPDAPQRVFLYEIYDDRAAFEAHLESDHFKAFDADVAKMTKRKNVETWELS